jgi:hypothetical protein
MKWCLVILALLSYRESLSQDSALILFREKRILLNENKPMYLESTDTGYMEKILFIGEHRYFYIKQEKTDTNTIECGQLVLRFLGNNAYLLREGFWIVPDESKKIYFQNICQDGYVDETRINLNFQFLEGSKKRRKQIKVKKTGD